MADDDAKKPDEKMPGTGPAAVAGDVPEMPAAPERMIELARRLQERLGEHLSGATPTAMTPGDRGTKPPRLH
ncbi:hypothetical protein [Frigidibacter sp. MR17.24]|uniref:hypothetical protein n=1 Tax=Frigidibacter sp. MR17.24 TaxID=3127345 RepID=UPI003012BB08